MFHFQLLRCVCKLLATLLHFCFGFFVELSVIQVFETASKIHNCAQSDILKTKKVDWIKFNLIKLHEI